MLAPNRNRSVLPVSVSVCVCCQVLAVLHESLPDLVGLDVDLATTTAAADALADADLLMASGRGGGGGGGGAWQYVPAPMLTVVGLVRRDTAGVGVLGSAGLSLAWPRAQVGGQHQRMTFCWVPFAAAAAAVQLWAGVSRSALRTLLPPGTYP